MVDNTGRRLTLTMLTVGVATYHLFLQLFSRAFLRTRRKARRNFAIEEDRGVWIGMVAAWTSCNTDKNDQSYPRRYLLIATSGLIMTTQSQSLGLIPDIINSLRTRGPATRISRDSKSSMISIPFHCRSLSCPPPPLSPNTNPIHHCRGCSMQCFLMLWQL